MRRGTFLVFVLASGWSWLYWVAAPLLAGNRTALCDNTEEDRSCGGPPLLQTLLTHQGNQHLESTKSWLAGIFLKLSAL
jgi:hypothetical protein